MEIPYEKNGKDAKGEITNGTDASVEVCEAYDDLDIDARARLCSVPEERNRAALEQSDEEKDDARDYGK